MSKQRLHQQISYVKSALRIIGYALLFTSIILAAITLIVAEGLGIAEEVYGS